MRSMLSTMLSAESPSMDARELNASSLDKRFTISGFIEDSLRKEWSKMWLMIVWWNYNIKTSVIIRIIMIVK